MAARLTAMVLLFSVILMGTVSRAEACAIWCLGSNGMQKHSPVASGMARHHHHAGMTAPRSVSVGSRICETNCSGSMVARVGKSLVSRENISSERNPLVGDKEDETAERDGDAVVYFEVAGPPGLVRVGESILRI